MIIESIQDFNLINGASLFVRDCSERDFEKILKLLIELDLKRDVFAERLMHEDSKKEFEKFLKFKYDSKSKIFWIKSKNVLLTPIRRMNGPKMINSIFSNDESFFSSGYLPKEKLLTIVWKSKEYSVDDLVSIILSN